ncbi:hypothetical protein COU37_01600 [Candidatus Micrarchaeota archaeon CG10_big_fil_rev_8_21_14_0_10_45_29]|nr:MAG: hypothetical protein COU37_01600 [Candidatus Micrarchaeota archaeon CG10_big_fil_rev_8_21_14_0_10_45_29]
MKTANNLIRLYLIGSLMANGQAAMEYLVLLAIILVVALIGIVILGGFAEGGGNAMETSSKAYWSGSAIPFGIEQWAQINDTLYITLVNKRPERYILRSISLSGDVKTLGVGWTVGPNARKNISISGLTQCDRAAYDYFSYDMIFNYTTTNGVDRLQIGAKPLEGSCSFP